MKRKCVTLLTVLAASSVFSGCAKTGQSVAQTVDHNILMAVVEAHNRLAECMYDNEDYKGIKPCLQTKFEKTQPAAAPAQAAPAAPAAPQGAKQ